MAEMKASGGDRWAAAAIAVPGLLVLMMVMHHPTVGPAAHDAQALASEIGALSAINRAVHAALLALFAVQTLGFYLLSLRLGLRSPSVAAAFGCTLLSLAVMIVPLTLDGAVTADVAALCTAPSGCPPTLADLLRYTAILIQEFTKVALVLQGIGILCFGARLLRGRLSIPAGLVAFACGLAEAGIILAAPIRLTPHSLALILLAQGIWSLAAAASLASGRLTFRR